MGRSFFDFVMAKDEEVVRNWIEVVKGWGVNERGQPSDGGFGFGKFSVCTEGRDSRSVYMLSCADHDLILTYATIVFL